ncbi:S49 family peptidase [Shewanella xiamenensis]|uniref:S49 family peptidase n=1 Tax=Shewanella xiamenensis TaxID=332186 RepID=UPI00313C1A3B
MQVNYPNLASMVFNTPLLATRTAVDAVKSVLIPRITGNLSIDIPSLQQDQQPPERLATIADDDCDVSGMYTIANGRVAVIPVHGLLMARRGHITAACTELNSYEKLQNRMTRALNNNMVEEIALDFNTGGGMAVGCKELADFIYQSRQIKPINAIVNYSAYSAGYFMASACSKIIVSATSGVGSIGVIMEHMEVSKLEEKEGLKFTTFYRGDHKNDGSPHEPITEQAIIEINARLDETYRMFTESVAQYRGMEVQKVIDTQARLFGAREASSMGLADELMTPFEAINAIAKPYMTQSRPTRSIGTQAKAMNIKNQL